MKAFEHEVRTFEMAHTLEDALAAYDLFEFENRVKPDYANVGGVQFWSDESAEWEDIDTHEDYELRHFAEEFDARLTPSDREYIQSLIVRITSEIEADR